MYQLLLKTTPAQLFTLKIAFSSAGNEVTLARPPKTVSARLWNSTFRHDKSGILAHTSPCNVTHLLCAFTPVAAPVHADTGCFGDIAHHATLPA